MSYARIGTYEGDPDAMVAGFEGQTDKVRALDGFERAFFGVDRESGKGISITIWESKEALDASAEAAKGFREEATGQAGAQISDVSNYEIAITL